MISLNSQEGIKQPPGFCLVIFSLSFLKMVMKNVKS